MATIATQLAVLTGLIVGYSAAGVGGDTFANTGNETLRVKNASGGTITVTVASIQLCNQGATHNVIVTVAAAAEKVIGPFDVTRFGTSPTITYDTVTSVTVAVERLK